MGTASRVCTSCDTPVPDDAAFCPNCGEATPTGVIDDEQIDQQRLRAALIERYWIRQELGRGGMAVVYVAQDVKHDRQVAVKVMLPKLAATLGARRFLREIQIAARLNHPHIVALYDSGEAGGFLYYVMPYVEGESLRARLKREPQLPIDDALEITREAAEALGYAHEAGVVHRDIKPENVLLTRGHALVADFGIAKAVSLAGGSPLTSTGISVGTPLYMSPEQAGADQNIDGRADIYSLGCVLYEMLAGEPPFTGPNAQAIMAKHAMDPRPCARTVRDAVPDVVDEAIGRAMATAPVDRFGTAAEFARALVSPASGEVPRRTAKWRTLTGWGVSLFTVVALALLAVLVMTKAGTDGLAPRRLVVATFANETGDSLFDAIGVMAQHFITDGLQRTGAVQVVPTPTAMQVSAFAASRASGVEMSDPIRTIADQTGSGLVISGTYFRDPKGLRFHVQVNDAVSEEVLASLEPVTAQPDSVHAALRPLRDRLMGLLSTVFDERLTLPAAVLGNPPSYDSFRSFKEGMEAYVNRRYWDAIPLLYEAARRDSAFAAPLMYAALTHLNLFQYREADSALDLLADRERFLSDYERYWLQSMRAQQAGDLDEALRTLRLAASLAPGSKAVYNVGLRAMEAHRPAEALAALLSLDPEEGAMRGFFGYWRVLTDAYHELGDHHRELAAARRARSLYPDHPAGPELEVEALVALGQLQLVDSVLTNTSLPPHWYWNLGRLWSGAAEEMRAHGHHAEADRWFAEARDWMDTRPPDERDTQANRWMYGWILFWLEDYEGSQAVFRALLEDLPGIAGTDEYGDNPTAIHFTGRLGVIAARLGEEDEARATLQVLDGMQHPYARGLQEVYQAYIEAALGNKGRATEYLRESFAKGNEYGRWFHRDGDLESLLDYPPFQELMRPKG